MLEEAILPDSLLAHFRARASRYDRDNAFFTEDLEELREAGYLSLFVPESDGGRRLGLEAVASLQRRLATAAPATALAINMHLVWTGVAQILAARGDGSLGFVLQEAGHGELFAFGISEAGNDSVLFDALTVAEPSGGGSYRFTGRKIFTSLSPAWTRLGVSGKDQNANGGAGALVFGFVHREAQGYSILDDWDAVGMRATQSNTTVLEGTVVPAERIFRTLPVGPNADPLIFAIFACFETLLAAVYAGIGQRALELAVEAAKRRTSLKHGGRSYAQDPAIRWKAADAAIAMEGLYPHLTQLARDVDSVADHGELWFAKLVALKVRATETARTVVELAIRVAGGSAYFSGSELGRLYRDVLAGMFHPSNDQSAHNTVATAWLGALEE